MTEQEVVIRDLGAIPYRGLEKYGAREMAWWLIPLAALSEDSGSIPSTHRINHRHLQLQLQGNQHPLLASTGIA